jgi:signal transduction histidine kinase
VSELSGDGLRAHFVASDSAVAVDGLISPAVGDALYGAAREALSNTLKHSGTTEAVLRLTEADGGISVIARDHGCGFDPARRRAGFGIENSIIARLADVDGHADVTSSLGGGTRVTLWAPRG